MRGNSLGFIGAAILVTYLCLTIVLGWIARNKRSAANDLLNASRSLPVWIASISFLAANCGALEIVGLSAMAAQYGVPALHFYWIGAVPAMVFVSLWMLPAYLNSGVHSVPDYLERRYDRRFRLVNACITALTMLVLSGINLYAIAQVLQVVLGLKFFASVLLIATIVLTYILLGGVRATIYNEVLQLAVILGGLLPLFIRTGSLKRDWHHLSGSFGHLWRGLPIASMSSPLDGIGVVVGLGFILSFSYWGTDFVLMQRALAVRSDADARQVPLWAAFGKLAISFLVILPALRAARFLPGVGTTLRYDQVLPELMAKFYGPALLGFGLTALIASLMSGLSANISAFAAIWTQDIYRVWLVRGRAERHYLRMGTSAAILAMLVGIFGSGTSFYFGDLMELVQLIFSLFSAPFWAIFFLGISTDRVDAQGAFVGFLAGTAVGLLHHALFFAGVLHYGSVMNANFHVAIYGFLASLLFAWIASDGSDSECKESRPSLTASLSLRGKRNVYLVALAAFLILTCLFLNILWR